MRIIVSPLVLLKNYMKPILLFTGSLLIVSIASSQNVGINTDGSTPSMLLHLKIPSGDDGIRVQNASGSGDGFFNFQDGTADVWSIGFDDSDANKFKFSNSGALGTDDKVTIQTDGWVGVRTSSPQSYFEVKGDATASAISWVGILRNPDNSSGVGHGVGLQFKGSNYTSLELDKWAGIAGISDNQGSGSASWWDNVGLAFYTVENADAAGVPTEAVRINSAGNVGIGTSTPSAQLVVNEDAVFNESGGSNNFRVESNAVSDMFIIDGTNDRIGIKMTSPANVFDLEENSAIGATDAMQSELNGATGGALDAVSTDASNGYSAFECITYGTGSSIFAIQNNTGSGSISGRFQTASIDDQWGIYSSDLVLALNYYVISDGNLKTNIQPIESALTKIDQLVPVTYNFKRNNDVGASSSELQYGFTSQNVQGILPELVATNSVIAQKNVGPDQDMSNAEYKYSSVNYQGLIPILAKGIKEQQLIIENQNKRIEELERLINEILKGQE